LAAVHVQKQKQKNKNYAFIRQRVPDVAKTEQHQTGQGKHVFEQPVREIGSSKASVEPEKRKQRYATR
jgi:hypothetical protein